MEEDHMPKPIKDKTMLISIKLTPNVMPFGFKVLFLCYSKKKRIKKTDITMINVKALRNKCINYYNQQVTFSNLNPPAKNSKLKNCAKMYINLNQNHHIQSP